MNDFFYVLLIAAIVLIYGQIHVFHIFQMVALILYYSHRKEQEERK